MAKMYQYKEAAVRTCAVPPTVPAKSSFESAITGCSASTGGVAIRTAESDASSIVKIFWRMNGLSRFETVGERRGLDCKMEYSRHDEWVGLNLALRTIQAPDKAGKHQLGEVVRFDASGVVGTV